MVIVVMRSSRALYGFAVLLVNHDNGDITLCSTIRRDAACGRISININAVTKLFLPFSL